jgi:hypothetical protein
VWASWPAPGFWLVDATSTAAQESAPLKCPIYGEVLRRKEETLIAYIERNVHIMKVTLPKRLKFQATVQFCTITVEKAVPEGLQLTFLPFVVLAFCFLGFS